MARGRSLSQDLRRSLIYMGCHLHLGDVIKYSDCWVEGHARHTRIIEAQRRAGKS
ncbi:hypothetical protein K435DRAFT_779461 [Dendrothele bispora CBS 962.96]|uniref:Uncharacterized protein n=1 Tax=Dendrothele bispora (strain CBS 962.96) TaxID=1314807 RepID=A0A4S8LX81_DENBC|nr:hypothetical protein K435DRAFT_779461 [Dendrothele bispora CBS 962.96]